MVNPHDPGSDSARARFEAAGAPVGALEVSGHGELRVGTASWTDPTMTAAGVFYPPGCDSAAERLRFYASQFPVVEVDSTYYALPVEKTAKLWVERTPPDFMFDIKAHALMTGQPAELKMLPKELREQIATQLPAGKTRIYGHDLPAELRDEVWSLFIEGVAPLRDAGKLGAVFLQFPRWVFPGSDSRAHIAEARARLAAAGIEVAVEFRHPSWFSEKNAERTLKFLEEQKVAYVMVDGPQGLPSSMPFLAAVTSSELAVLRMHGRRVETWEAKGIPVVERFRYLYDEDQLADWVPRIRAASKEAKRTHVLMNNCFGNYGTTNARELAVLLKDQL